MRLLAPKLYLGYGFASTLFLHVLIKRAQCKELETSSKLTLFLKVLVGEEQGTHLCCSSPSITHYDMVQHDLVAIATVHC